MSDDELRQIVKRIAREVREDDQGKTTPIKSCVISVPNHAQICLPNVKFGEECDEIATRLTNLGYRGTSAFANRNTGCDPGTHAVLRTPLRRKKKS